MIDDQEINVSTLNDDELHARMNTRTFMDPRTGQKSTHSDTPPASTPTRLSQAQLHAHVEAYSKSVENTVRGLDRFKNSSESDIRAEIDRRKNEFVETAKKDGYVPPAPLTPDQVARKSVGLPEPAEVGGFSTPVPPSLAEHLGPGRTGNVVGSLKQLASSLGMSVQVGNALIESMLAESAELVKLNPEQKSVRYGQQEEGLRNLYHGDTAKMKVAVEIVDRLLSKSNAALAADIRSTPLKYNREIHVLLLNHARSLEFVRTNGK